MTKKSSHFHCDTGLVSVVAKAEVAIKYIAIIPANKALFINITSLYVIFVPNINLNITDYFKKKNSQSFFRAICCNGLVCGDTFGEVRVPHKGDVVNKVIEGAYEVLGTFDAIADKREEMQSLVLPPPAQHIFAQSALTYRYGEEHHPITEAQVLQPRRVEDKKDDLWTVYQRLQENLIKGGLSGRNAKGKRARTRSVNGIDGDIKLNKALWVLTEQMHAHFSGRERL